MVDGSLKIDPGEVGLVLTGRSVKGDKNPMQLVRARASDQNSPLWRSTTYVTVPQWNALKRDIVAESESVSIFSSQLAALVAPGQP